MQSKPGIGVTLSSNCFIGLFYFVFTTALRASGRKHLWKNWNKQLTSVKCIMEFSAGGITRCGQKKAGISTLESLKFHTPC